MDPSRAIRRLSCVLVVFVLIVSAFAARSFAQRQSSSKYAKGDRVEVEDGFGWRASAPGHAHVSKPR